MSNPDLYQQLLEEVAKREAELEKARAEFERTQEAARKAAEALRAAAAYLKPGLSATGATSAAPVRAPLEPPLAVIAKQPSFIDVVADSIQGMDNEITTARVFQKLSAEGVPLGDDPRTKISTALSRLEQRGTIVKIVAGSIGRAHAYLKPSNILTIGGEKG